MWTDLNVECSGNWVSRWVGVLEPSRSRNLELHNSSEKSWLKPNLRCLCHDFWRQWVTVNCVDYSSCASVNDSSSSSNTHWGLLLIWMRGGPHVMGRLRLFFGQLVELKRQTDLMHLLKAVYPYSTLLMLPSGYGLTETKKTNPLWVCF